MNDTTMHETPENDHDTERTTHDVFEHEIGASDSTGSFDFATELGRAITYAIVDLDVATGRVDVAA